MTHPNTWESVDFSQERNEKEGESKKTPPEKRFICTGYGCDFEKKVRTRRSRIECERCDKKMKKENELGDTKITTKENDLYQAKNKKEVTGDKIFVCDGCRIIKQKSSKISSTRCPSCGRGMKKEDDVDSKFRERIKSSEKIEFVGNYLVDNIIGDGKKVYVCKECNSAKVKDKKYNYVRCLQCGSEMTLKYLTGVNAKARNSSTKQSSGKSKYASGKSTLYHPDGEKLSEQPTDKPKNTTGESTVASNSNDGNGRLKTVGDEVDGEKKVFICRECSLRKEKAPEFSSTRCPKCSQKMDLKNPQSWGTQISTGKSEDTSEKQGYVYVMVNSAKPEMVKIGMTERDPEKRAAELSSSTGVAVPYVVAYEATTDRPKEVEKAVHNGLSEERVNPNREFFRVKAKRAIKIIDQQI